jgi:hypothetical protein
MIYVCISMQYVRYILGMQVHMYIYDLNKSEPDNLIDDNRIIWNVSLLQGVICAPRMNGMLLLQR